MSRPFLAVSAQPLAVAIDDQTSRAFIVNYGGRMDEPAGWAAPWAQAPRRWLPPWALRALPDVAGEGTVPTKTVPGSVSVLDLST